MSNSAGWIGVDLDGTLAEHYWPQKGDFSPTRIGDPIPLMVSRVLKWLDEGKDVRIFTARVGPHGATYGAGGGYPPGTPIPPTFIQEARNAIEEWSLKHLGRILPVTATKDYKMRELWDDRAIQVEKNTGKRVDGQI